MPRHEIIVERIPDEFQGKPVRLPPPSEMSHIYNVDGGGLPQP